LLMNSSIDIAKITIETLKVLIEKYSLENIINMKQVDQLIEIYTKKSVRLNVVQPHEETSTTITVENKPVLQPPPNPLIERRRSSLNPATYITKRKGSQDLSLLGRPTNNSGTNNFSIQYVIVCHLELQ
ncbi:unnamed protein product, partial [Adineta steineri]